MGASLAVWQPHAEAGPVTSLAEALDRALRIPGSAAALLGDLSGDSTLSARHPKAPEGLAQLTARSSLAYARAGEPPEELVLTGRHYTSLMQTTPVPTGGHAFVQVTLLRAEANLALARMALPDIVLALPALLARQRAATLPRRKRTETGTAPPRRAGLPTATLQRIIDSMKNI
ncbi:MULTISPECIES: hypothetical protein [Streptacidiphilus]|uniref:Uncharacterized protein n=1 Tax=Streptacidiphilus cavernicola TaxID=3342716 RepID=A0ABV6UPW9_9ACTN|nr:hypothetical protein [Streptacidiphilus jeojiense]